ncbi:TPA: phage protein NinX family protein [Pseudomonas aeruginosa]
MSETVEVNTCDLEGAALNWAVAFAENEQGLNIVKRWRMVALHNALYVPSSDWSQGGPLITKYLIEFAVEHARTICAYLCDENGMYISGCSYGDTYLIAACRAIVTAKLGETVNVPAELIK